VDDVGDLVRAFDGRAAVFARRLDAERSVEVGEVDRAFPTGSAAKLLVLLAYAQLVADGSVHPDVRVRLEAPYRDARGGSGLLRHLAAGLEPTLEDCATLMMVVSDNVATDLLLDAIGGPAIVSAVLEGLGCSNVAVTSPTVWALPPAQFGMASPRGLAEAWTPLAGTGPLAERCRRITWRHQHREGFARHVPFSPDLPDFGMASTLRLWSKAGSYPSVSCEGGLFQTDHASWVLAVMADDVRDWSNGSTGAGPTLRAEVSRVLFDAWGRGS
jgi:beta-lactamase class A